MKINFNNQVIEFAAPLTVASFLDSQNIVPQGIALAIEQQVIPKNEWQSRMLKEGDHIVIFKAIAGG